MTVLRHTVGTAEGGSRLDRLLGGLAPAQSRAALQRLVRAGACLVDGLPQRSPAARVRAGQRLALELPAGGPSLAPEEGDVPLLWRDAHVLVCDKPAGLTVHPCPSCPSHTLVQRLLAQEPRLGRLEGLRPGIVHRLDKDTSGLLAVALSEPDRLALSGAFARREVRKEYLALVGGVPPLSGECREPLGRHPTARVRMAVVPEGRGGRPAHSAWRVLWAAPDESFSLLAVRIFTGRTHQIRVHMAHVGHPLLGDALYAPPVLRHKAPRQMLHAWHLEFTHPATGERLSFLRPPPADFLDTALAAARRMRRVVVTGNPGSGKSAVAHLLGERGVPVASADAFVAASYAHGGEAARWLGGLAPALLTEGGAVDRPALLAAMQGSAGLKREVERVTHALVRQAVEDFWRSAEAGGAAVAVAEIPLWFEAGWQEAFAPAPLVLGVRCPLEQRQRRVAASRGWDGARLATLEAWQWPEERKMAACDLVLDNAGDRDALQRAVAALWRDLEARPAREAADLAAELTALWS